jgi:hypothetical protein
VQELLSVHRQAAWPRALAKHWLLTGRALFSMAFAYAATVPQVFAQALPASVIACADETDAGNRLACYDREIARLRASSQLPGPTASTSVSASAPMSASVADSFGMTGDLQRKQGAQLPHPLDKLSGRIAAVTYKAHGEAIVRLEGGQVWEEAEPEPHLPLRPGDTVTIKRGMLGSFYMSSDRVLGLRVRRVQ